MNGTVELTATSKGEFDAKELENENEEKENLRNESATEAGKTVAVGDIKKENSDTVSSVNGDVKFGLTVPARQRGKTLMERKRSIEDGKPVAVGNVEKESTNTVSSVNDKVKFDVPVTARQRGKTLMERKRSIEDGKPVAVGDVEKENADTVSSVNEKVMFDVPILARHRGKTLMERKRSIEDGKPVVEDDFKRENVDAISSVNGDVKFGLTVPARQRGKTLMGRKRSIEDGKPVAVGDVEKENADTVSSVNEKVMFDVPISARQRWKTLMERKRSIENEKQVVEGDFEMENADTISSVNEKVKFDVPAPARQQGKTLMERKRSIEDRKPVVEDDVERDNADTFSSVNEKMNLDVPIPARQRGKTLMERKRSIEDKKPVVKGDFEKENADTVSSVSGKVKFDVPAPTRRSGKTSVDYNVTQFAPESAVKSLTNDIVNLHRILMDDEPPEISYEVTASTPTNGHSHQPSDSIKMDTINSNVSAELQATDVSTAYSNRNFIPLQDLLYANTSKGGKVPSPEVPTSDHGGDAVLKSTLRPEGFKNENVNGLHLAETAAAGAGNGKESRYGALLAAFVACLGSAALGTVIGYASPAIPDIQTHRNPFHLHGVSQMAWVASMIALGEMVGGGISGPVLDRYGRKMVIIANTVPFVIGWLIIAAAPTVEWLFVGRFLTGFCAGVIDVAVPVYLAEVSPADIRGFVGSCYELFVNLGIFFVFGFGCVLRYNWLAIACAFVPTVMMIAMCYMPETPRFLMSRGNQVGAQQALTILRGAEADTSKELNEILDNIKQSTGEVSWRDFVQPTLYKPLYIVLGLMLIQQFSGYGVVYEYTVIIFSSAGIDMSPNLQTAIVGLSGVVSNLVSAFIVDRTGRRVMLFTSAGIMAVSMATMGIFFIVKENNAAFALNYISWLPILSLVGYNFGLNIGFGPIPFYMAGELFPLKTRGITCGICIAIWSLFFFLVSRYFMEVTLLVHDYGAYWILSGVSLLAIIFVIFVVPETKGKTLEEIEDGFRS